MEIVLAERVLKESQEDYESITGFFKKKEKDAAFAKITDATIKLNSNRKDLGRIVMKEGYATVQAFISELDKAKKEHQGYLTKMEDYEVKYADKDTVAVTQAGKMRVAKAKIQELEMSGGKNTNRNKIVNRNVFEK